MKKAGKKKGGRKKPKRKGGKRARKPTTRKRGAARRSVPVAARVRGMSTVIASKRASGPVDNRRIRNAINVLSGFVYSGRKSQPRAEEAARYLASVDLSQGYGRRGGTTRSNTTSGLRCLAEYETKTGKKLSRCGGFSRKAVNEAKRILKSHG